MQASLNEPEVIGCRNVVTDKKPLAFLLIREEVRNLWSAFVSIKTKQIIVIDGS